MSPRRLTHFSFCIFHFSFCILANAEFPAPTNNQPVTDVPLTSPQDAVKMMHLPPGFKATLFAAEPDVQNPIAMCWDERGRLWIAENYTYSDGKERFDMKLRDRILIFEDTDNDGHFDKRTVFFDDLQMLTSIERGFGGVYALCPPHLLFIPTKDDKPSGPPQIVLDGFSTTAGSRHTFANGLKWGPDGWLYGRIGISSTSWIGVPGDGSADSPVRPQTNGGGAAKKNDADKTVGAPSRLPTAGGIWRYHPTRKIYEPYCHGTTNPWGMDWDEHGEMFFINTVIGHLWHGIQGAHFKRMHGEDPYPHIYGLIDQHADHYHWDIGAEGWSDVKKLGVTASSSEKGGGHAHCGMMIYQGTNFPKEYRGKVFTNNLHGHRVNVDRIEREGSGYTGKHEPDFMKTDDPWFRATEIQYGPDGGVYILDWSDIGECHEQDGVHRTSGRIYKITYGDPVKPKETDMTKLSDEELVKLQLSDNEWLVRMARWELRKRYDHDNTPSGLRDHLFGILTTKSNTQQHRLNALFTLWQLEAIVGRNLAALANDPDEQIQSWAVALDYEHNIVAGPALLFELEHGHADLAKLTASPLGRRTFASIISHEEKPTPKASMGREIWPVVMPMLLSHAEDATDHNLPLMYWFGIRDLPPAELVKLVKDCRIPLVTQFIARRITEDIEKDPAPLNALLTQASKTGLQPVGQAGILPANHAGGENPRLTDGLQSHPTDILRGMTEALKGWRKAKKPEAWDKFAATITGIADSPAGDSAAKPKAADKTVRAPSEMLRDLNVVFGSGRALDEVRVIALDDKAGIENRRAALRTLVEAKSPDLRKVCESLLGVKGLAPDAMQGLATFDDPALAEKIFTRYFALYPHERPQAIAALASRPSYAKVLLNHLEGSKGVSPLVTGQGDAPAPIPRNDISPLIARQIRSFNDEALTKKLTEVWGEVRESSDDKKKLIAALKVKLTPDFIKKGDPSQGRMLYAGICAACHKLYGEGNNIGPDLTGSGRHDIGYLIENIADPSAVVAADYTMVVVTLKDGRVLNGIISAKTDRTITVKMIGMETIVDRNDIAKQEQLPISMMPEGQLIALSDEQVANLISYLMSNAQVPLPAQ